MHFGPILTDLGPFIGQIPEKISTLKYRNYPLVFNKKKF